MKLLYRTKHAEIAATKVTNVATIERKGVPPLSAKVTFRIKNSADLMVIQSTDKPIVYVNDKLKYTITVTNNGPSDASRIILTNILPSNVDLISVFCPHGSYTHSDRLINFRLGKLASHGSIVVTVTILPKTLGPMQNFTRVIAKQHDPNLDNNTYIETTTVAARYRGFSFF